MNLLFHGNVNTIFIKFTVLVNEKLFYFWATRSGEEAKDGRERIELIAKFGPLSSIEETPKYS